MLTEPELSWMRSAQEEEMPATCVVWRGTPEATATGAWKQARSPAGTYPCRYAAGSPRDLARGARPGSVATWTVTLPHDADVLDTDQLRIAGLPWLEVIGLAGAGDEITALRVVCKEA